MVTYDAQLDLQRQIVQIEDAVASGVDAQVISDNVLGGRLCAENLVKALDGNGNLAVIDLSTNMSVQDRTKGFFEVIDQYPDIKIVAQQDGDGSVEKALPIMENMMQANPDIDAVFGTNDPAAIGAIAALDSAGKIGDVIVVGIDGAKDACALINNGKMLGMAAQYPSLLASQAVDTVYKLFDGERPAEKKIYVNEEWIRKDSRFHMSSSLISHMFKQHQLLLPTVQENYPGYPHQFSAEQ